MSILKNTLFSRLIRLLPALVLSLCLALPALAHEGGEGGGGSGGGSGEGGGNAAEAGEAANDARDAAEAAEAAAAMSGGIESGQAPAAMELTDPGQGMTATSDRGASSGISAMDRAALDAVNVNRAAWSPF